MSEWNGTNLRVAERNSIRAFVEKYRRFLAGRVMDFGAGKSPYKDLVAVNAEYIAFEKGDKVPGGRFEAILSNQVLQYCESPGAILSFFHHKLIDGGHLVLTYPTNWPEVEANDYWRFTKAGMNRLLLENRFKVMHHEERAVLNIPGFGLVFGYGVIARKEKHV